MSAEFDPTTPPTPPLQGTTQDGVTTNLTGIAGIDSVTGNVANALPQYVYGRDAARLLLDLRSSSGKALFVFGDSRTYGICGPGLEQWTQIPVAGGTVGAFVQPGPAPAVWTNHALGRGANSVPNSIIYPGQTVMQYAIGGALEGLVASAVTQAELNHIWNRVTYTSLAEVQSPGLIAAVVGKDTIVRCLFRSSTDGVQAANIAFQAWVGLDYTNAPQFQRTAFFSTRATTPALMVKDVTIASTANWGVVGSRSIAAEIVWGNLLTVVNETICAENPWIELADGSGTVVFDYAVGGQQIVDLLDAYLEGRVPGQLVRGTLFDVIPQKLGHREPWFLIDLGTNGTLFGASQLKHEGALTALIEKLRSASGYPDAKVLLRTAYPGGTNDPTQYYQLAAIAVAKRMRNVICVDTYGASFAGGGYPVAVANGWFGGAPDGVHRASTGRQAWESMFDAILSGLPWTYTATRG